MNAVLATLYEAIVDLAIAIQPVIPALGGAAARHDGRSGRTSATLRRSPTRAATRGWPRSGFILETPSGLFPRLELPAEG